MRTDLSLVAAEVVFIVAGQLFRYRSREWSSRKRSVDPLLLVPDV